MTATVEALLKDLQSAVTSRALYPAEHPRTRAGIERIEREVQELTAERGEISVFGLGDKVVHDGLALPGSESLARSLFAVLKACGYDRLTIRRGVSREEIDEFVANLADASRRPEAVAQGALKPSTNIRLSSFQQARPGSGSAPLTEEDFFREETQILGEVWSGVLESRRIDMTSVEEVVIALSKTIEENIGAMIPMASLKSHDEYTATHIINVALLAMALSEAVSLPEEVVHDIGIAALLHDVGKLQVPLEILNKPDRLTEEEFAFIKKHPEDGARALFSTPGVPEMAVIVSYEHHLWYDGSGYPQVRPGWKTNLASAITQIADIYDALRTDRPYRRGLERDTIVRMMTDEAGKHFAPDLLGVFFARVVSKTSLG